MGGDSNPGNVVFFSLAMPASAPMYGPNTRVLSSDTPESANRAEQARSGYRLR